MKTIAVLGSNQKCYYCGIIPPKCYKHDTLLTRYEDQLVCVKCSSKYLCNECHSSTTMRCGRCGNNDIYYSTHTKSKTNPIHSIDGKLLCNNCIEVCGQDHICDICHQLRKV